MSAIIILLNKHKENDKVNSRSFRLFSVLLCAVMLGTALVSCTDANETTDTTPVTETQPAPEPDPIAKFTGADKSIYTDEAITVKDIFTVIESLEIPLNADKVTVTVKTAEGNGKATIEANTEDWTAGKISFDAAGKYEFSITDDEYCIPAVATVTAIDPIKEIAITDINSITYDSLLTSVKDNPRLETLNLGEFVLTSAQYVELRTLKPETAITGKVSFEKFTIELPCERIDISGNKIQDREALASLLAAIPGDSKPKIVMSNCGYTNDELAALRDKLTNVEVVWRLYFGNPKWSIMTDDEAFSVMIYTYDYRRMTSADIEILKYTTNMKALDLGHQAITDLSVFSHLTELRVLILADNRISDISPLKDLKKLEYLELFVNQIRDVSPLADLINLLDLNLGWNYNIKDISSLYNLKQIERLWLPTTGITYSKALQAEITANFVNAKCVYSDPETSIGSGWRSHPRYKPMRGMFLGEKKYDPNFATYKAQ